MAELSTTTLHAGVPVEAMSEASAQAFAVAWIEAWNRGDVEGVLAHYADDAVFISPNAARFVGTPRVNGKLALGAYWRTALAQIQNLHFTLDSAFWSQRSETLTVLYWAALGSQAPLRAVEIMRFQAGQVVQGEALYGASAAAAAP